MTSVLAELAELGDWIHLDPPSEDAADSIIGYYEDTAIEVVGERTLPVAGLTSYYIGPYEILASTGSDTATSGTHIYVRRTSRQRTSDPPRESFCVTEEGARLPIPERIVTDRELEAESEVGFTFQFQRGTPIFRFYGVPSYGNTRAKVVDADTESGYAITLGTWVSESLSLTHIDDPISTQWIDTQQKGIEVTTDVFFTPINPGQRCLKNTEATPIIPSDEENEPYTVSISPEHDALPYLESVEALEFQLRPVYGTVGFCAIPTRKTAVDDDVVTSVGYDGAVGAEIRIPEQLAELLNLEWNSSSRWIDGRDGLYGVPYNDESDLPL